jgi:hypothetical protein
VTLRQSQRLQVLDNLQAFFFGQGAPDHAVALWPVLELMPCVRNAVQVGAELRGSFERIKMSNNAEN